MHEMKSAWMFMRFAQSVTIYEMQNALDSGPISLAGPEDDMNFDSTLSFNISRMMNPNRSGAWLSDGPNGPGLGFGTLSLHDAANPSAEAELCVDQARLSRTDRKPALALVFGLGLGYHLKALRRRYPSIRLLVFEPIAELKSLYENHKILSEADGEAPEIYLDWFEFEKQVSREVVYGRDDSVAVLAPEGYKSLRPEAFGTFASFIEQELIRRSVIEKTRENSAGAFLNNLAVNTGHLANLPDLLLLKGFLPSRPAFVVGSGPSLNKNARDLKGLNNKALIIAASSALKPLLAWGVSPDLVLALESEDTSSYLDLTEAELTVLGDNKILALASSCHPAHFEVKGFIKAVFHLTAGAAQIFSRGDFLPQGGNCGSAGFALAYVLGMNPLVLVGQDQAYEGGRLHADGTPGEVESQSAKNLSVTGLDGRPVETDTGLLASLGWFIEAARTIAQKGNPPRLFNCSAGGAEVPGFINMPLATVTASLPPLNDGFDLAAFSDRLPRPGQKELSADLDQLASLVGSLRRLARMDYRKAYVEVHEAGKLSKFLGQILAEAAVASGRKELLASLEKADELMTLMRSSLN